MCTYVYASLLRPVRASWSPEGLVRGITDGSSTVFTPASTSGCTRTLVTQQHKAGVLFVFDAADMSKVGEYVMSVNWGEFTSSATYSPAHNLLLVTVPVPVDDDSANGAPIAPSRPPCMHLPPPPPHHLLVLCLQAYSANTHTG